MIEFSPRWVAVALAAALTASPVLDAAAQTAAPVVPAATWDLLLKRIEKDGVLEKAGDARKAVGKAGSPDAAHTVHRAEAYYEFDGAADIVADVMIGVEKFVPTGKAGEFKVLGWHIFLNPAGKVFTAQSDEHIWSAATGFRRLNFRSVNIQDPVVKERLDEALRYWTTR